MATLPLPEFEGHSSPSHGAVHRQYQPDPGDMFSFRRTSPHHAAPWLPDARAEPIHHPAITGGPSCPPASIPQSSSASTSPCPQPLDGWPHCAATGKSASSSTSHPYSFPASSFSTSHPYSFPASSPSPAAPLTSAALRQHLGTCSEAGDDESPVWGCCSSTSTNTDDLMDRHAGCRCDDDDAEGDEQHQPGLGVPAALSQLLDDPEHDWMFQLSSRIPVAVAADEQAEEPAGVAVAAGRDATEASACMPNRAVAPAATATTPVHPGMLAGLEAACISPATSSAAATDQPTPAGPGRPSPTTLMPLPTPPLSTAVAAAPNPLVTHPGFRTTAAPAAAAGAGASGCSISGGMGEDLAFSDGSLLSSVIVCSAAAAKRLDDSSDDDDDDDDDDDSCCIDGGGGILLVRVEHRVHDVHGAPDGEGACGVGMRTGSSSGGAGAEQAGAGEGVGVGGQRLQVSSMCSRGRSGAPANVPGLELGLGRAAAAAAAARAGAAGEGEVGGGSTMSSSAPHTHVDGAVAPHTHVDGAVAAARSTFHFRNCLPPLSEVEAGADVGLH